MWVETLREQLRPRRLLPALGLVGPLAVAQYTLSADRLLSTGITGLLVAGFYLFGPWSWRWCRGRVGAARWMWPFVALAPFALAFVMTELTEPVPSLLLSTTSGVLGASLCVVGSWGLGRDIELELGLREAERRAASLQRATESARLLALDAHLDPHFLFNTLNAIAEWCAIDAERAEQAILDLAGVLRIIQEAVSSDGWPLSDELDLARRVLALHHARDPDCLRFEVREVDLGVAVPPLLLLPLVENAVTHGRRTAGGTLEVVARRDGEMVEVKVRNPGAYNGPRAGGYGLRAVRERIALAWGDRATLEMSTDGKETIATLRWPHG